MASKNKEQDLWIRNDHKTLHIETFSMRGSTISPEDQPPSALSSHPDLQREYWCFISYRHADNKEPGRQWATWLHQALETYEVPADLAGTLNLRGQVIPERIFPVFRDEEELPADAELSRPIKAALDRSRFMVVLCSPRAVQSTFVADEILHFKQQGKKDQLLAAIIEGQPNASDSPDSGVWENECFPRPLRYALDASGQLSEERAEPIAADFSLSDGSQGWTNPAACRAALAAAGLPRKEIEEWVAEYTRHQKLMLLKIIAGVLGVPLGVLTKRDAAYLLEQQKRRARVLRRWLTLVLSLILLASLGGGLAYWFKHKATVFQQIATESSAKASTEEAAKEKLMWKASRADHASAVEAMAAGRSSEGLALFSRALERRPDNQEALAASAVHAFGTNAADWRLHQLLRLPAEPVIMRMSPDGKTVALACKDKSVHFYDIESGAPLLRMDMPGTVHSLGFSPDSRHLAIGGGDIKSATNRVGMPPDIKGYLKVVHLPSQKLLFEKEFNGPDQPATGVITSCCYSPDGSKLALGVDGSFVFSAVRVVNAADGTPLKFSGARGQNKADGPPPRFTHVDRGDEADNLAAPVSNVAYDISGRMIAVSSGEGRYGGSGKSLSVLNAETGQPRVFGMLTKVISSQFSTDGRHLLSGGVESRLQARGLNVFRIDDLETEKNLFKYEFAGEITHVVVSPDSRCAAVADRLKLVIFDLAGHMPVFEEKVDLAVTSIDFSPDGHYVALGGADRTLRVLDISMASRPGYRVDAPPIQTPPVQVARHLLGGAVSQVCFSTDGRYLAAASADKTLRIYQPSAHRFLNRIELAQHVLYLQVSAEKSLLRATIKEGAVGGGRPSPGADTEVFGMLPPPSPQGASQAQWLPPQEAAPNGTWKARKNAKTLTVFDSSDGTEVSTSLFPGYVGAFCFHASGKYLAACSSDPGARVLAAESGSQICNIYKSSSPGAPVIFNPEGTLLGLGNERSVLVYDCSWFAAPEPLSAAWPAALLHQSGAHMGALGELQPAAVSDLLQAQQTLVDFIAAAPAENNVWQHAILKWSRSAPELQATSPWQPEPLRTAVGRWLTQPQMGKRMVWGGGLNQPATFPQSADEAILDCAAVAPWHPLIPLALAKLEPLPPEPKNAAPASAAPPKPQTTPAPESSRPFQPSSVPPSSYNAFNDIRRRGGTPPTSHQDGDEELPAANKQKVPSRAVLLVRPRILAQMTLRRLYHADEKLYGRDELARYAAWSAQVMFDHFQMKSEAIEAVRWAQARASNEWQPKLKQLLDELEKSP